MKELRSSWPICASNGKPKNSGVGNVARDPQASSTRSSSNSTSSGAAIKEKQVGGHAGQRGRLSTNSTSSTTSARSWPQQARNGGHRSRPPAAGRRLLRQEVGPEEIAEVVSAWTGIPVTPHAGDRAGQAAGAGRAIAPADDRSGRGRRGRRQRRPPQPLGPARSRIGRSARSSSWARPASAKPSFARPWPKCCSTTRTPWSGST